MPKYIAPNGHLVKELRYIADHPGCRQCEIVNNCGYDHHRSSTEDVERLERSGLVTWEYMKTDTFAKPRLWTVTPLGRDYLMVYDMMAKHAEMME